MPDFKPIYTSGEKAERRRLLLRGARQALGAGQYGDGDEAVDARVHRRLDRLEERAMERGARVADKLVGQVDAARDAEAEAIAAVRSASGRDKADARRTLRDAQKAVRRAEGQARRAGVRI